MDLFLLWDWYVTLVIMISLSFYVSYKWNRWRIEAMAAKIPGPKTLPIVGNLFYFKGITHDDFIYKIAELAVQFYDYGLLRIWLGPLLVIGLYKPEHLEAVLCSPKIIDKSLIFSFFQPRSEGAFTLSGEIWRKKRRLANKMFHANLLENFANIFNEKSVILVEYLKKEAESGTTFDVSKAFMRCTLDVICRNALGVDMNLQYDETITFPDDLTKSSEIILQRAYKPWLYPTFIFKRTKIGKEMFEYIDRIHQFTMSVIKKRRKIIEESNLKIKINGVKNTRNSTIPVIKNDSSNHVIEIQKADVIEAAPYIDALLEISKEENLSDLDLALEALDVIIGGMDTSAIADSYVLLMLGMHKEWQDKVHKEIDEVFGNSDRHVTSSDLALLVNLDMVIKEVLRLYTAPHSVRLLTDDVKLDKYTLPAGAIVYLSIFVMHRAKEYWSNPEEFYPEHFLPENVASRPKHSFLPFSVGPRGCPGSRYGILSMKILLTNVLRNFRVECDLKYKDMMFKPSLMLELVGGYRVRLIPRKPSC